MFALVLAGAIFGACANPSIISTGVKSVTQNGALKHYAIAITVRNIGNVRQPTNLLQSINVDQDGERTGRIGLQPLRPKQSQTVTYGFDRSADSGDATTDLTFSLTFNHSGNNITCHAGNETATLSV